MAKEYLIRVVGEGAGQTQQEPAGATGTQQTKGINESKATIPKNTGAAKTSGAMVGAAASAMVIGRGVLNFATSSVAEFTGSQEMQAKTDNMLKAAGFALAFKINPAIGAAAVAIDFGTSMYARNREIMWKNKELEEARARVAYSTRNRSRE